MLTFTGHYGMPTDQSLNEETLQDELLPIKAVLKGYPTSMARSDALRSVERLKKEIPSHV